MEITIFSPSCHTPWESEREISMNMIQYDIQYSIINIWTWYYLIYNSIMYDVRYIMILYNTSINTHQPLVIQRTDWSSWVRWQEVIEWECLLVILDRESDWPVDTPGDVEETLQNHIPSITLATIPTLLLLLLLLLQYYYSRISTTMPPSITQATTTTTTTTHNHPPTVLPLQSGRRICLTIGLVFLDYYWIYN